MSKRKIVISSIVGTVALLALSLSFTLAWYASSDRLSVDSFEVKLKCDNHLLISTQKEHGTYKNTLEKDELKSVDLFVPVSSMHKNLWMDEHSDTPIFYDNSFYNVPSTGIPQIKAVKRGFYQQKLYLLSDISYYVSISALPNKEGVMDTFFESNDELNFERAQKLYNENPKYTIEEYTEKLNNLKNCLRMSILLTGEDCYSYYIIDPFKKESEVINFAGRLDNDNDGYYDTYECLENGNIVQKETVYGEVYNRDQMVYDNPTGEEVLPIEEIEHYDGNSFMGLSKGTAYTYNEVESLKENKVTYAQEQSLSLDDLNKDSNPLMIPCYAGQPREIVISIYLEGWDSDCINATMGASFINSVSFKLAKGGLV